MLAGKILRFHFEVQHKQRDKLSFVLAYLWGGFVLLGVVKPTSLIL